MVVVRIIIIIIILLVAIVEDTQDAVRLTAEQLLLVAQERRGLKVPNQVEQARILVEAHALGHYGEKSMYKAVEDDGWWWASLRQDIKSIIAGCKRCQRYSITRAGYSPARSITALHPADHFQMDLMEMPKSLDGYVYALVIVDVFTGFVLVEPLTPSWLARYFEFAVL